MPSRTLNVFVTVHASCRAGFFARGQGDEEWRLIAAKQFHAAHRSFVNGSETGKVCKRFPLGRISG